MSKIIPNSSKTPVLKEGEDYIFNDAGLMVLTRQYHLKRGYCCSSGCQNCPYGYGEKIDPSIPVEMQLRSKEDNQSTELSAEDYLEKYSEYLENDLD